jgi:hypothetical protein
MITLAEQRGDILPRLSAKHLFAGGDHLFDVLPGSHAQATMLITEEVTTQMKGDRSSALQLKVALVDESISNSLWVLGDNG